MEQKKSQEDKLSIIRYNAKYRRVIEQLNVCDFIGLNWIPRSYIKKISKKYYQKARYIKNDNNEYIKQLSEEVFEVAEKKPDENGVTRNKRSLRAIFNELRYLINSNFGNSGLDQDSQLFITLTYKENMQDDKRLYKDFKKFMMRLKHRYSEHEFLYIAIIEPQERGAWHIHLLLKSNNKAKLFIPYEDVEKIWGHGATRTERLNCDNIGSYFIAYLSNAELSEETIKGMNISPDDIKIKFIEEEGKKIEKKYIKGSRLKFYPDYMQIYRHSKNVVYPGKVKGTDNIIEAMENLFPNISYQNVKEIETEKKTLVIGKEQRKKEMIK